MLGSVKRERKHQHRGHGGGRYTTIALTVQGRFETTKNSVRVLPPKGVVLNSRRGSVGDNFEVVGITSRARGVGPGSCLLVIVHVGGKGVRRCALIFRLLNDLTGVLLCGLGSVRVGEGGLGFRSQSPFNLETTTAGRKELLTL